MRILVMAGLLTTRKGGLGDKLSSAVVFRYTTIVSVDERVKKILLTEVRPEVKDLDY